MRMRIIAVGKLKENYIKEGIKDYLDRINRFHRMEIKEIKESFNKGSQGIEEEGERICKVLDPAIFTIVLTPEGTRLTTEELSKEMQELMVQGQRGLDFVIGGHEGLALKVKQKADLCLSLSSLTFPYQLTRLILSEQIYRCLKIIRGEQYHR